MRIDLAAEADVIAAVRAATGDATLVLAAGRSPLALALATAAIGPLAVERAPIRVNAVVVEAGADPRAVDAAAAFLDTAASTTGQVLTVN